MSTQSQDNYRILLDVQSSQNRLEDKFDKRVDAIFLLMSDQNTVNTKKFETIDNRLSILEGLRFQILLVTAAVVFFVTLARDYLFVKLFGKAAQ